MAAVEHWWCPDCCAFDGPITDGCCDVCDLMDEHSSGVVRLVPASARDEARALAARLMEALTFIATSDDVDNALDPHRNVRVAVEALSPQTDGTDGRDEGAPDD